ncbi:MAG: RNA polymerase sigma factor SigA [Parcubacteria group bacterium ADurb.Bin326]|nr:MAG: RNA polymerase sigma factor SigA [Parcubacteria group bacterium ADurb.Bin326]
MSILDQVRKNKFKDGLSSFNPVDTLGYLFDNLSEKEKDIITKRFGLGVDKRYTLEEIGQKYGITRERVRQIENLSIKKLKELRESKEEIREAETLVVQLLEQYGGVMEESFFLENVLNYLNAHSESENSLLFLAEHIFTDNINKINQDKEFNNLWRLGVSDVDFLKKVITEMVNVIEQNGDPISLDQLLSQFKSSAFFNDNKEKILFLTTMLEADETDVNKILESYLRASRKIRQDIFNNWGLISWGIVKPKKINDKIYLTLKKSGRPMHFTEIADSINGNAFDGKVAYAPTVHNELILDEKYVLVGRGIYALKEWGYKPGNVADVIEEIIRENGPLTKDEIIEKVLERRNVKRSTVYLSLMNHKKVKKNEKGKYAINENSITEAVMEEAIDQAAQADNI